RSINMKVTYNDIIRASGALKKLSEKELPIKQATPADGYKFVKWSDENISASRTVVVTEATTYTAIFEQIQTYYLDLNGMLDGVSSGGISPYGTADIYINGSLVSIGCGDFWQSYEYGTTYEIKNIKANDGYQYNGVYSGLLSGMITETTNIVLSFSTVKPPEFTSASLIYADSQVSQNNKVPTGEHCILSVGVY
ncbi:MAG: hypothetical protein ACI4SB_10160, partial [Acutalibacteraceae bacterium]